MPCAQPQHASLPWQLSPAELDWTAGPQRAAGRMSSPAYLSPTLPEPYTDENVGEPRDGTGL
jgi:hypothetical protein